MNENFNQLLSLAQIEEMPVANTMCLLLNDTYLNVDWWKGGNENAGE